MAKPKIEVALAAVPIFEALSRRQLKKVASVAEVVNYMGGHSIVKEGDEGESIFIVLAGQAKVTVKGRTVGRTLPGDHFGEISLLDGGPRTATVMAKTDVNLLGLTEWVFRGLMSEHPTIALKTLQQMAGRLRVATKAATA